MLDYLKRLLTSVYVKRAATTFALTFIGAIAVGIVPWFHDLTAWVTSNGQTAFPSWHNLSFILLSAILAAAAAVAHLVVGGFQVARLRSVKHAQTGAVTLTEVCLVLITATLILALLFSVSFR